MNIGEIISFDYTSVFLTFLRINFFCLATFLLDILDLRYYCFKHLVSILTNNFIGRSDKKLGDGKSTKLWIKSFEIVTLLLTYIYNFDNLFIRKTPIREENAGN